MAPPAASSSSSSKSSLLLALLVTSASSLLWPRAAGVASVPLRPTPEAGVPHPDLLFHGAAAELLDKPGPEPQPADLDVTVLQEHGQVLQGLDLDGGDPEDTLEFMVPPDLWTWTLPWPVEYKDSPGDANVKMALTPAQRRFLSSLPSILPHFNASCGCKAMQCSCCARVELNTLHKNKTGCIDLTYDIRELSLKVGISFNNRTLLEKVIISGRNPPPLCVPIPQFPIVRVCLRISNISLTLKGTVQACAAAEGGLSFSDPLIKIRLGCLQIGRGGLSWSKNPLNQPLYSADGTETESALQQFTSALNTTDNEQFLLLQSILKQQGYFEQASTALPSRNQKTVWSTIH